MDFQELQWHNTLTEYCEKDAAVEAANAFKAAFDKLQPHMQALQAIRDATPPTKKQKTGAAEAATPAARPTTASTPPGEVPAKPEGTNEKVQDKKQLTEHDQRQITGRAPIGPGRQVEIDKILAHAGAQAAPGSGH